MMASAKISVTLPPRSALNLSAVARERDSSRARTARERAAREAGMGIGAHVSVVGAHHAREDLPIGSCRCRDGSRIELCLTDCESPAGSGAHRQEALAAPKAHHI